MLSEDQMVDDKFPSSGVVVTLPPYILFTFYASVGKVQPGWLNMVLAHF